MLRLFHSLFAAGAKLQRYPESLVREAIERAVDGTDPALRAVRGYRKRLRPAVLHAIDHVVALADALAPPIDAGPDDYDGDPRLRAFFVSAEQMRRVLDESPALADYRRGAGGGECFALLATDLEEKQVFGAELAGETLVRDVAQTTVSFGNFRLFDPAPAEAEARRLLKRRAFDHLLGRALGRLTRLRDQRAGLADRRTLLQAKIDLLQRCAWGFDRPGGEKPVDRRALEGELAALEERLLALGGAGEELTVSLELVADFLGRAEAHLWSESLRLAVDPMGIKRAQPRPDAPELDLQQLCNDEGRRVVVALLRLPA